MTRKTTKEITGEMIRMETKKTTGRKIWAITVTITMESSVELMQRNKPLLDRLGKFGQVLGNLLLIGTAASEVNSPSPLLIMLVSDRSVG
jgi:hypothetical protein